MHSSAPEYRPARVSDGPPTALLALSFSLAGLGTVMLGPVLPALLREWQLTDQRGGLLLLAKFFGAFAGGLSIPARLRLGVFSGHLLAAMGFAVFALAHGLTVALPALFVAGLGLGILIASTNILAGRRWPAHAGSALSLLNFFWSLGAVSTGMLAAWLLPRFGWRTPVLGLSALLAASGVLSLLPSTAAAGPSSSAALTGAAEPPEGRFLSPEMGLLLAFGALLFLYGGLETCLTAWLTTFSLRFAGGRLLGGQSGFVVLWLALTVGRVVGGALMRRAPERAVQRGSLVACLVLIPALATAHTAMGLSAVCVLLGLALAPVFPSTFALLLRRIASPRMAGSLLAVSGLGAALFPWVMGVVSTATGSLRVAMLVPALLVPAMLLLTFARPLRGSFVAAAGTSTGEEQVNPAV